MVTPRLRCRVNKLRPDLEAQSVLLTKPQVFIRPAAGEGLNQSKAPGIRRLSFPVISLRARVLLITGLTLATIVTTALLPRIPQSEAYHSFADQRAMLGISNLLNVASNLPFLLTGIWGLLFVIRQTAQDSRTAFIERSERWPYLVFFIGVALTSFGSAYYHLAPGTERLMWDRLPMSIAFMSLLAAVVGERVNLKAGMIALPALLAVGAGSVIAWHLSEQNGNGDLRAYVLVQFYSMFAIILTLVMFSSRYSRSRDLVLALVCYSFAKVLELLDLQIFAVGRIVSGHTLKHLAAAASAWWIIHMLKNRVPASPI